jgi:putative heme-binding domain-containing protein
MDPRMDAWMECTARNAWVAWMRVVPGRVVQLLFAVLGIAGPLAAAEEIVLFDGTTLEGFHGDSRYWTVEDGAIVGRTTDAAPLERNTYLIHERPFADFVLRLEYRLRGGNSGIQYRSRDLGEFAVAGYQADLEDGPNWTGMLYEERGRGILCRRGTRLDVSRDGTRRESSLGDADALLAVTRASEWNEYEIVARGNRLIHRINGARMIDVVDQDENHAATEGSIAFQLHTGPAMEVAFRNVRIERLAPESASEPEWIWARGGAKDGETCRFERDFELPAAPRFARLAATADDHHETSINGVRVAAGDDWRRIDETDVTAALRTGRNTIAMIARNDFGPAGAMLRLVIEFEDGTRFDLVSDASFRATSHAGDRGSPPSEGAIGGPQGAVESFGPASRTRGPWGDPFAERVATPVSAIRVPQGFVVERVASARRDQGSWVAMAFDGRGGLTISPQSGPLLRAVLEQSTGRTRAVISPLPLARPLGDAQGLLHAFGALYVVVSGEESQDGGLWRCRDDDGDGVYESVERIYACGPGGEHGPHGVVAGPDDRLYLMLGNHVSVDRRERPTLAPPEGFAATSPLRGYGEDLALPRIEDPNGHAVGVRAPGGVVVAMAPDGSRRELYAGGMRNAYDLAFAPDGELFTFDSDMEWDVGLPFYRPTRICHLVPGADFGWRSGSGKWSPDWFDSLPSVVDVGLGSPTGVAFATDSAFPSPLREALFVGDWTFGRIFAIHLEPRGASFAGTAEVFAEGTPLNVTDLVFGEDGALWFLTGGRGTQSGLYRVAAEAPREATVPAAEPDRAAAELRARRRALERMPHDAEPGALREVLAALDHEDRFLRYAARLALERMPFAAWRGAALAESRARARYEALLALVRSEPSAIDLAASRLFESPFESLDRWQRLAELRVLAVAAARGGAPREAMRRRWLERYAAAFPSGDDALDRDLLVALRRALDADLAVRGIERAEDEDDPAAKLGFALAIRDVVPHSAPELRARFDALGAALRGASGGFSFAGYLDAVFGRAERPAVEYVPPPPAAPRYTVAAVLAEEGKSASARSKAAGRAVFEATLCAHCHRFAGKGGGVGPDLTSVAGRFSRADLLEAILEPSKVISDQYRDEELLFGDGTRLVGRVVAEDARTIEVAVDPFNPRRVAMRRGDLIGRTPSKVSSMPERLVDGLEAEAILDLLAYLESGGN